MSVMVFRPCPNAKRIVSLLIPIDLAIEDLLDHRNINLPKSINGTFKSAQKTTEEKDTQKKLKF